MTSDKLSCRQIKHLVLDVQQVNVCIGQVSLLKNISTQIFAGEMVAIVGANGAGKSTLLKAISGELAFDSGRVDFLGSSINTVKRKNENRSDEARNKTDHRHSDERARHVAVLPQFSLLNFPYTVEEVVALGRTPHKSGLTVDTAIVAEAMASMDVSHLAQRIYTQLSGGEKQRTQLARVLTQLWREQDSSWRRILLLDEPTASLDLGHQQQLMRWLQTLAAQGVAVVMVLHDVNLASRYASRLLAMRDGAILAQGEPSDIMNMTTLKALFNADVRLFNDPQSGKPVIIL